MTKSLALTNIESQSWSIPASMTQLAQSTVNWGYNLWQGAQHLVDTALATLKEEPAPLFIQVKDDTSYQSFLAWKRTLKADFKQISKKIETFAVQGQWILPDDLARNLLASQANFKPEFASPFEYQKQLRKLADRFPRYVSILNEIEKKWQKQIELSNQTSQYFYQDSIRFLIHLSRLSFEYSPENSLYSEYQQFFEYYSSHQDLEIYYSIKREITNIFQYIKESSISNDYSFFQRNLLKLFHHIGETLDINSYDYRLNMIETSVSRHNSSSIVDLQNTFFNILPSIALSITWFSLTSSYQADNPFKNVITSALTVSLPIYFSQLSYVSAQATEYSFWNKQINFSTSDQGYDVFVDSNNSIFMAGSPNSYLSKWYANGTLAWGRSLSNNAIALAIKPLSNGNLLLAGNTNNPTNRRLLVTCWTQSGTLLWGKTLGSSSTYGTDIAVTKEDDAIVVGVTLDYDINKNYLVVSRWTSNGSLSWCNLLAGPSSANGNSAYGDGVAITPAGDILVITRYLDPSFGQWQSLLSCFSSSGTMKWSKTLTTVGTIHLKSIYSYDNSFLAVGSATFDNISQDLLLTKWSVNGTLNWIKKLGGSGYDTGNSISPTPEGDIIVAGETRSYGFRSGVWLTRWTINGTLIWSSALGGGNNNVGNAVSVDSTDNIIVVGGSTLMNAPGDVQYHTYISRWNKQGITLASSSCLSSQIIQPSDVTSNYSTSTPTLTFNTWSITPQDAGLIPQPITALPNDICNIPPSLTNIGGSFTYTRYNPATIIDNSLTINGYYNMTLNGAKVAIASGFQSDQDVLSFTEESTIIGFYNSSTGQLVLSGIANETDYQTALRSITYANMADNFVTTPRTFSFTVNDNLLVSNTVSKNATMILAYKPVLVNHAFMLNQGQTFTIMSDNLSAYDVDSNNQTLTFAITNLVHGNFTRNNVATLQFVQQDIGAGSIRFSHDNSINPPSFSISVSDGSLLSMQRNASVTFFPTSSTSLSQLTSTTAGSSSNTILSSNTDSAADSSDGKHSSNSAIIGGVVAGGGLLVIGGIAAAIAAICYKKRHPKPTPVFQPEPASPPLPIFIQSDKPSKDEPIELDPISIKTNDDDRFSNTETQPISLKNTPRPSKPEAPKNKPLPTPKPDHEIKVSFSIPYDQLSFGQKLGEGGFGTVYRGTRLHDEVAIKQLKNNHLSPAALSEFSEEMNVMAKLRSPNIVQLYGVCVDQMPYCLVMEYMPNGSLYGVLHSTKTITWPEREIIAFDMAKGLAYLHSQNVWHRDLKSLNVLLDSQNHAKLADFGLARAKNETKSSKTKDEQVGTIAWMAPELFERHARFTEKADVYSYGMTLWEMASRQVPFHDAADKTLVIDWVRKGTREEVPAETPPKLAKLIKWCWSAKREDRPSVNQIIETLKGEETLTTDQPLSGDVIDYLDNNFSQGKEERPLSPSNEPDYLDNFSGPQTLFKP